MNTRAIYRTMAYAGSLIGVGMILGHSLGNGTTNTPVWIGGLLILSAATLFGMSISSSSSKKSSSEDETE